MINTASKIYVAGHQGLVGSALARVLKHKGYNNIITRSFQELDARDQYHVTKFFAEQRPEYVFLAAAKVGGIGANATYKAEFMYDNIMIATNVIHASYRYGVKKLINFGSSCIYPKFAPQPLKEEYLLSGTLEPTNEPYALAKIAAIKLCRYYNEQYGTNFISLMPTNLYGPNDNFNLETAHVLPALIRKFHLAKLLMQDDYDAIQEDFKRYPIGYGIDASNICDRATIRSILGRYGISYEAVTLWGTGTPYREFLHVDDVAQAALLLAESFDYKDVGECINVGSGTDCSIDELATIVSMVVGYSGKILYDATKPDGTPRKLLDITRLYDLGWRSSVTLADGVRKVYVWYSDEQKVGSEDNVEAVNQSF
jgi:GDP-L-fucose synthase